MIVEPTKNWTWETVAPAAALALASTATEEPTVTSAPATGPLRDTEAAAAAATVTLTAEDVIDAPFESVTRAVSEAAPVAVGVHVTEFDEPDAGVLTMPTKVEPAKNSTFEIVAGATELAVAVTVTPVFIVTDELAAGAVSETLGTVTVTLTAGELTTVPLESVTRALNAVTPEADGFQVIENVDPIVGDRAVPTIVEPTRKSTRLTVADPLAVAVALRVVELPSPTDEPLVGTVSETVGVEAVTVTLTAVEVIGAPLESVTRAVIETAPATVGVQFKV